MPGIRETCRHALAPLLLTLVAAPSLAFDLEGHRGTRGLAPENTLAAFRRALEIGVTTIETDMSVTKDDVVVISHNPSLNPDLVRDTDGHWLASPGPPIRSLTLAELRRYDIGRINPMSQYAREFPEQKAADGERGAHWPASDSPATSPVIPATSRAESASGSPWRRCS